MTEKNKDKDKEEPLLIFTGYSYIPLSVPKELIEDSNTLMAIYTTVHLFLTPVSVKDKEKA